MAFQLKPKHPRPYDTNYARTSTRNREQNRSMSDCGLLINHFCPTHTESIFTASRTVSITCSHIKKTNPVTGFTGFHLYGPSTCCCVSTVPDLVPAGYIWSTVHNSLAHLAQTILSLLMCVRRVNLREHSYGCVFTRAFRWVRAYMCNRTI